jgi:hypothetical protein
MKKTSTYLELILKSLEFFEKASHHFKKASIQSLIIFVKVSEASISLKMSLKCLKIPHITGKSLHFSLNVLKNLNFTNKCI